MSSKITDHAWVKVTKYK